jgi:hypothetical protein
LYDVSTIQVEGLELRFDKKVPPASQIPLNFELPMPSEPQLVAMEKDALEQDELLAKEERLRMLLIEDPMEFERQLAAGELIDDEPNGNDDGIEE